MPGTPARIGLHEGIAIGTPEAFIGDAAPVHHHHFALRLRLGAAPVQAQPRPLIFAVAADVTSLDPHHINIGSNNNALWHFFDALTHVDEKARLIPGLAVSWRAVDATTWEFKLRPNVKFHDGSPFSSADVVFSIQRAQAAIQADEGSPAVGPQKAGNGNGPRSALISSRFTSSCSHSPNGFKSKFERRSP